MRADRLISLVLLLQREAPLTAAEVARRLAVSIRTIYRDMDSLVVIGVPIISTTGPHGGYQVMPGYRNEFARLSNAETNAVIAAASGGAVDALGHGELLRRGLEKLAAQRSSEMVSRPPGAGQLVDIDPDYVLIDDSPWISDDETGIVRALAETARRHEEVELDVAVVLPGSTSTHRTVKPLGLAYKLTRWHLVCEDTVRRVIPVGQITGVAATGRRFAPPDEFDLRDAWRIWCSRQLESMVSFTATLEVDDGDAESIRLFLGGASALLLFRPTPAAGVRNKPVLIECRFDSYEEARSRILGLGGAARVIQPESLRLGILDYAEQVKVANS